MIINHAIEQGNKPLVGDVDMHYVSLACTTAILLKLISEKDASLFSELKYFLIIIMCQHS